MKQGELRNKQTNKQNKTTYAKVMKVQITERQNLFIDLFESST